MAREGRGCDMHRHGTATGSKSFVFAAYLPSELKNFLQARRTNKIFQFVQWLTNLGFG
jgi:hypothetical protein